MRPVYVSVGGNNDERWALDAEDQVFHYLGNEKWEQIEGRLRQISVGSDGAVWGVNAQGGVYRYLGNDQWEHISGQLAHVSVGSKNQVWGVNAAGEIYQYQNGRFNRVNGILHQISVNKHGHVWGVNRSSKEIFRYTGQPAHSPWEKIEGRLDHVSIGANGWIWGVNLSSQEIFRYTGQPAHTPWQKIQGRLKQISVGDNGTVEGVNSSAELFRYTENNQWKLIDVPRHRVLTRQQRLAEINQALAARTAESERQARERRIVQERLEESNRALQTTITESQRTATEAQSRLDTATASHERLRTQFVEQQQNLERMEGDFSQLSALLENIKKQYAGINEKYKRNNVVALAFAVVFLSIAIYRQSTSFNDKLTLTAITMLLFFAKTVVEKITDDPLMHQQLDNAGFASALIFLGSVLFYQKDIEELSTLHLMALLAATVGVFIITNRLFTQIDALYDQVLELLRKAGLIADEFRDLINAIKENGNQISARLIKSVDRVDGVLFSVEKAIAQLSEESKNVLVVLQNSMSELSLELKGNGREISSALATALREGKLKPECKVNVNVAPRITPPLKLCTIL